MLENRNTQGSIHRLSLKLKLGKQLCFSERNLGRFRSKLKVVVISNPDAINYDSSAMTHRL